MNGFTRGTLAALTALAVGCGTASTEGAQSVAVAVSPATARIGVGRSASFSASVTGTVNTAVTWAVQGAGHGTVSSAGQYTAPSAAGTYTVVATSVADPTKSASATVTVTATAPTIAVTVSPKTASLSAGATLQLSATVTGSADTAVSWTVQEGAAGGAVSASGLYTAPSTAGIYHIRATAHADGVTTDTATLTVTQGGACVDVCPAPNGVTWNCQKRFMYGANWAWRDFGGDFGGLAAFNWGGVAKDATLFNNDMRTMKSQGMDVLRWWMFPRFYADGISYDANGTPSAMGGSVIADVQKALELAEQNDVYIMFTPFSFDGFKPDAPLANSGGKISRGIQPIVIDAARRKQLFDVVIVPIAKAVEASPYKKRMIAWDLMNEPEWAISGSDTYGDPAFGVSAGLNGVTFSQMETFLQEMTTAIRANSTALITVGQAAPKWPKAFSKLGLDFYTFHYYGWVYQWYPWTCFNPGTTLNLGKPVVAGEYPASGFDAIPGATACGGSVNLPARTGGQAAADFWQYGFAGGLPWAYNDAAFAWPVDVKSFADAHVCETKY
jgi:hypothetical protein